VFGRSLYRRVVRYPVALILQDLLATFIKQAPRRKPIITPEGLRNTRKRWDRQMQSCRPGDEEVVTRQSYTEAAPAY